MIATPWAFRYDDTGTGADAYGAVDKIGPETVTGLAAS